MPKYLTKRSGFWHFVRRVPDFLADRDTRGIVKQSTRIRVVDDPRGVRAQRVADRMNEALMSDWRRQKASTDLAPAAQFRELIQETRRFGFYSALDQTHFELRLEVILLRLEIQAQNSQIRPADPSKQERSPSADPLKLSDLFAEFEVTTTAANRDMSSDQRRRWRHAKQRAISNLTDVVGNKPLADLTRGDALDFQDWWRARVLDERMSIATANKDFGHLSKMLKKVSDRRRLGLSPVFSELRIPGERVGTRAAFEIGFVQDHLLRSGALDGLLEEAKWVIYLIAETGLRLSEAVNLSADTIVLKHKIPHIKVRPDRRRLKTEQSERDIPLVGVALDAMRSLPNGFPRYRDKANHLSMIVNKHLLERQLRPTKEHTLYSLRHTFEDRLTAVEAPEKLIANLMGHKYARPKYGAGPSLEQKLEWLQRIAFKSQGPA